LSISKLARFFAILSTFAMLPAPAFAQAPPTGPLALRVPISTRATALGDAWVAGRDADVVFYNPAQLIGVRPEFNFSLGKHGGAGTTVSLASVYAAGPRSLTFGWGVQFLDFTHHPFDPYPYSPDVLLTKGTVGGQSMLATVGGAFVVKGLRIGVAGKYTSDRVVTSGFLMSAADAHALVADIGVARNLVGGVGALSIQNIGHEPGGETPSVKLPRQVLLGWSTARQAGPLDLGIFSQLTIRDGWTSPGGGLEASYSWIEGYAVTVRVGARRPETTTEVPVAIGAAFSADHLTVEYALQFFDGGRYANRISVRWR
jgi:hypothetical protein